MNVFVKKKKIQIKIFTVGLRILAVHPTIFFSACYQTLANIES